MLRLFRGATSDHDCHHHYRADDLERHYRDARVLGIGGDTTGSMNEVISKLIGL